MTERRYSEAEVAEILKHATAAGSLPPQRPSSAGLSLTELQEIATEVGIPAERITAAAHTIDATPKSVTSRVLGLPMGVRDGVVLPRRLTDDEWDQMVVAARETFAARGTLHTTGEFREWTNGNLAMLLEPHGDGHQIRFQTTNSMSQSMLIMGLGFGTFGAALLSGSLLVAEAKAVKLVAMGAIFVGMAMVSAVAGAARLPGWAKRRREQMQLLSRKALALAGPKR